MKKNISIWLVLALGLVLLLSACGEKSQEDVLKNLDEKLDDMNGYKATAEMTMDTGQESQKFNIDVWHKKKDLYRVKLTNDQDKKGSQVILKNKEGVFVLTPSLNKSFKFQSKWPDNGSQPYLYQSLVDDIKKDSDAQFSTTDSHYVFQTKTNYQSNNNLPYQEIYFDKKTYTPVLVKVLDKDKNAVVEVKFTSFKMDPSFKEDDFEMEKNMTSNASEASEDEDVPVSADPASDTFTLMFPLNTAGAALFEQKEMELENGKRVIMTFKGEKNFTLVEEKINVVPTMASPKPVSGDIVNLGFAIGALSENSIEWHNNGMNFYLASDDLTREELIEVAKSVQGKEIK
ncbi:outer membrane lipoprotein carrier protein LolA [Virgibacillus necropolis]|uniref:LolA family protein n=1 Tax=Virgibacillus necropolis TaxID=163877 RepID=UPI00384AF300